MLAIFPKYLDTQITLKFELCGLYHRAMGPNDADGMANNVDPDQTAPRSSLIWVCTVCPGLAVRKLRIIMVQLCLNSSDRYANLLITQLFNEQLFTCILISCT